MEKTTTIENAVKSALEQTEGIPSHKALAEIVTGIRGKETKADAVSYYAWKNSETGFLELRTGDKAFCKTCLKLATKCLGHAKKAAKVAIQETEEVGPEDVGTFSIEEKD